MSAKHYLNHGMAFPYDSPDTGRTRQPKDAAMNAARGVLANLCDRRGIKSELLCLDLELRKEIIDDVAAIIRLAMANEVAGEKP